MEHAQTAHRLPTILIVSIVAINALGIGIILPVMPGLLMEMGLGDIASAAAIGGLLSFAFAAMQILFAPLLGSLSDRFGRKPVLIISLLATGVDYAILASASVLWLFFLARLVSGVTTATFAVANASLADLSPPEKRASSFGLTGAAFGVGFVMGPALGGMLAELGTRAPFWAAAGLCFLAASLCALFLAETSAPSARRELNLSDAIPFASFAKLRKRRDLIPLVSVNFLDAIAGLVYPAVFAYFAIARYGWSTSVLGIALAIYGLSMAIIQAGLIRVFLRYLGEARTAVFGLSAGILGFIILSFLSSGLVSLILTPLFALRAVSSTALTGLMSRQTTDDAQGELQGILAAVSGVATLLAIPLMTQVFAMANAPSSTNPWPGAPFAVAAVFSIFALVVLLTSLPRSNLTTSPQD